MFDPGGNTPPDQVKGQWPFTRLLRFAYREIKRYEIAKARRAKATWLVVVRDEETAEITFTMAWDLMERNAIVTVYSQGYGHSCVLEVIPLRPVATVALRKAA
jgi:uncharacterized protein (DUF608 family)